MKQMMWAIVVALLAPGFWGCGDGDVDPVVPAPEEMVQEPEAMEEQPPEALALTYHRDIKPLLDNHCMECHVEGGIAPFSFETYEDVFAQRMGIKASTQGKSMPPWLADSACRDYKHDISLSTEQIDALGQWVDLGAPEGDESEAPESTTENQAQGLVRADVELELPLDYQPVLQPDDYRCFLLDWPEDETKFVTGFGVNLDNKAIVHHVIAFLIPPGEKERYAELDAAEEGPGYTCFGTPGGSTSQDYIQWIGAWAPGSDSSEFPENTGIRVEPGSTIALQVHYNTLNGVGFDKSGVAFRLEDSVEKEAFIMPFANPSWIDGQAMNIPANEEDVEHSFQFDPTPFLSFLSGGVIEEGEFMIHGVGLHLHNLGTKGHVWIDRGDEDKEECMLRIDDWDFNWQRTYDLQEPVAFRPGDKLGIRCNWDNTAANQSYALRDTNGDGEMDAYEQLEPRDVNWGDGTNDEMCLGILYVTPR